MVIDFLKDTIRNLTVTIHCRCKINPLAVHDWIAPVDLERTIGKYFLFVRTGIGAPQINPGDFNRARPLDQGRIFSGQYL